MVLIGKQDVYVLMCLLVLDYSQGGGMFANKTFANRTFVNGESPAVYCRKYGGLSPIGENPEDVLARVIDQGGDGR